MSASSPPSVNGEISTIPTQSSSMFRLPGEIRNRIYDFVIAGRTFEAKLRHFSSPNRPGYWHKHFGLTQASHQLRAEFLPLCKANIEYQVQLFDLPGFADILLLEGGQDTSKAIGNVTIHYCDCPSAGTSVDVLPLMKLYRTVNAISHDLKIEFRVTGYWDDAGLLKDIMQLLEPENKTAWQHFTDNYVTRVIWKTGFWKISVNVFVKPSYFEEMLEKYGKIDNLDILECGRKELWERLKGLRREWEQDVGIHVPQLLQRLNILKEWKDEEYLEESLGSRSLWHNG